MSNKGLLLPSRMTAAERRATRPSQHPNLSLVLRHMLGGPGWHTRRVSRRQRDRRLKEARKSGLLPLLRQLGWVR